MKITEIKTTATTAGTIAEVKAKGIQLPVECLVYRREKAAWVVREPVSE